MKRKRQSRELTFEKKVKKIRTQDSHPEGLGKIPWPQQEADNVMGFDEAGWGSMVGPITLAGAVLPPDCECKSLHDSKLLSENEREFVYGWIQDYDHAIVHVDNKEVDELTPTEARKTALERAIDQLLNRLKKKKKLSKFNTWIAIMDGNFVLSEKRVDKLAKKYGIELIMKSKVKGDQKIKQISAASVFAKVSRDRLVSELEVEPEWENVFKKSKGYCTEEHRNLLRTGKTTPYHRKSYKLKEPKKTIKKKQ